MRKHLLSAFALVSTFLMVGSTIAEAADIKFSGQLRPRFEYQDRNINVDNDANLVVDGRVRLNALATIDDKTSAFIQMQAIQSFGTSQTNSIGGTRSPTAANDNDASMGVHQAFFTLKDFFGTSADLTFGRQEIIFDGHRIFGDTLWTAGEQSHDAIRLTHNSGNHSLTYAYSRAVNTDSSEASNNTTDHDSNLNVHAAYANFKGIMGGGLSLLFSAILDDRNDSATVNQDNDIYTIGFRQAGKMGGIKYRGEFYYQFGDSESHGGGFDHEAYMYGIRVGKGFGGSMKPGLTLWFDYLSGTSQSDLSSSQVSTFDTVFDTGHKFYGFADYWLNVGAAGRNGSVLNDQISGLGLMDFAIKGALSPAANWKLGAHLHFFWTAEDAYNNTSSIAQASTFSTKNVGENHLGEELDITLTHNYNPSTNIVFGYSHFFTDDLMEDVNHRFQGNDVDGVDDGGDADWAYIMVDVQF
jgi:hypothetical protein